MRRESIIAVSGVPTNAISKSVRRVVRIIAVKIMVQPFFLRLESRVQARIFRMDTMKFTTIWRMRASDIISLTKMENREMEVCVSSMRVTNRKTPEMRAIHGATRTILLRKLWGRCGVFAKSGASFISNALILCVKEICMRGRVPLGWQERQGALTCLCRCAGEHSLMRRGVFPGERQFFVSYTFVAYSRNFPLSHPE